MGDLSTSGTRPDLKVLVREASQALARLDASRLEELAASCRILNQSPQSKSAKNSELETREAQGEMVIFARVLEATRSNLKVMQRLRELRQANFARTEYSERQARGWPAGSEHGDD